MYKLCQWLYGAAKNPLNYNEFVYSATLHLRNTE